jgi:hypothetical protein
MNTIMKDYMTREEILKGAVVGGVINAVINGAIQAWLMAGSGSIPMSVATIGSDEHTVFSAAVPLAVSLAMILTIVAYTTIKVPKKAFFPAALWLVIKHGIFAFGAVVALAVVWQHLVGTVAVGELTAVFFLGAVAGLVSGVINYMSITALVQDVR